MYIECPSCKRQLRIGGLFLRTNKPGGELKSDGTTVMPNITCHYCDYTFNTLPLIESKYSITDDKEFKKVVTEVGAGK